MSDSPAGRSRSRPCPSASPSSLHKGLVDWVRWWIRVFTDPVLGGHPKPASMTSWTYWPVLTRPPRTRFRCHGRSCLQALVQPAAHGTGPPAWLRRPRVERRARLRLPDPAAGQLRQRRPAATPRRPRVACPLPRRAVALSGAAAGVPVRRRPCDGGAHADVYGPAVPEADRGGGVARARCAAAGAADRRVQRSSAVERGGGRIRADRVGRGGGPGISRRSGTSCCTRAAWEIPTCPGATSCRR